MISFAIDPRDNSVAGAACSTCCCQQATMKPGETNRWALNYSAWVAGLGGRGLVQSPTFDIQKLSVDTPGGNQPPRNTDYQFAVAFNTAFNGSVATNANDPDSDAMTYALVPLYGVRFGSLTLNAVTGAIVYTPDVGFFGYDQFLFATSDGINPPVLNIAQIVVHPASPATALPMPVPVPVIGVARGVPVNIRPFEGMTFPVAISPAAKVGDVYRLTVRAPAMDCDGTTFFHVSCYDIAIGAC